jgi:hypothetical protein
MGLGKKNKIMGVFRRWPVLSKNQLGILYEIPLLFGGYGILCAIFLPLLINYSNEVVTIIIFMIIGAGVSFLASLSITTERRLKILKIPICTWIYFGISLFSIPLMVLVALDESLKGRLSSLAIPLLVQSFLAFWLDYRLALWLEKKKSKE